MDQNKALVLKRIRKDLIELVKSPLVGVGMAKMQPDNDFWYVVNLRLVDGIYKGIIIQMEMKVPDNYPHKPPTMRILPGQAFNNKYHHHVYDDDNGYKKFCFDFLQNTFMGIKEEGTGWSPAYTFKTIFLQMQLFLSDPDFGSKVLTEEELQYLHTQTFAYIKSFVDEEGKERLHTFDNPYPEIYMNEEEQAKVANANAIEEVKKDESNGESESAKPSPQIIEVLDVKKPAFSHLVPEESLNLIKSISREKVSKLTCFHTHQNPANHPDMILGYPIYIKENSHKLVPEVLSHEGYMSEVLNSTYKNCTFNDYNYYFLTASSKKYNFWIPMYLNEQHYRTNINIILKSIASISKHKLDATEKDFVPEDVNIVLEKIFGYSFGSLTQQDNLLKNNKLSIVHIDAFLHILILLKRVQSDYPAKFNLLVSIQNGLTSNNGISEFVENIIKDEIKNFHTRISDELLNMFLKDEDLLKKNFSYLPVPQGYQLDKIGLMVKTPKGKVEVTNSKHHQSISSLHLLIQRRLEHWNTQHCLSKPLKVSNINKEDFPNNFLYMKHEKLEKGSYGKEWKELKTKYEALFNHTDISNNYNIKLVKKDHKVFSIRHMETHEQPDFPVIIQKYFIRFVWHFYKVLLFEGCTDQTKKEIFEKAYENVKKVKFPLIQILIEFEMFFASKQIDDFSLAEERDVEEFLNLLKTNYRANSDINLETYNKLTEIADKLSTDFLDKLVYSIVDFDKAIKDKSLPNSVIEYFVNYKGKRENELPYHEPVEENNVIDGMEIMEESKIVKKSALSKMKGSKLASSTALTSKDIKKALDQTTNKLLLKNKSSSNKELTKINVGHPVVVGSKIQSSYKPKVKIAFSNLPGSSLTSTIATATAVASAVPESSIVHPVNTIASNPGVNVSSSLVVQPANKFARPVTAIAKPAKLGVIKSTLKAKTPTRSTRPITHHDHDNHVNGPTAAIAVSAINPLQSSQANPHNRIQISTTATSNTRTRPTTAIQANVNTGSTASNARVTQTTLTATRTVQASAATKPKSSSTKAMYSVNLLNSNDKSSVVKKKK